VSNKSDTKKAKKRNPVMKTVPISVPKVEPSQEKKNTLENMKQMLGILENEFRECKV
jgi:hypothetical protein